MKSPEKTDVAPAAGKKAAALLFLAITLLLLIAFCVVSFLSIDRLSRSLDELKLSLAQMQERIAVLSEKENRLMLELESKADKETLDALARRLNIETTSSLQADQIMAEMTAAG